MSFSIPCIVGSPSRSGCTGIYTDLHGGGVEMDVKFLLREYGQNDTAEGCERRWVEFVGVPWAWREGWLEDELVFHRYTAV